MPEKSIENLVIVLNPGEKVFVEMLAQYHATEGWAFTGSDYDSWMLGFKKFWYYAAIEKGTNKFVASITLGEDHNQEGQEALYTLGMYYCHPDWRGSGIGTKMFDMIMKMVGDANVALSGVMKMSPRYASKYGFNKMPKYVQNWASISIKDYVNVGGIDGITTKALADVPFADVIAYDRTILPRERSIFLKKWIDNIGRHTRVAYDSSQNIVGFCCIREVIGQCLSVGPFYADFKDVAQTLLSSTLATVDLQKFKKISFYYPAINEDLTSLVSKFSAGKGTSVPYGQAAFTKYVIATADQKVYSMTECANSIC